MPETDRICVVGIDCVASIGVTPEERTMKQCLGIDVELTTDIRNAARHDSLKEALDYSKVAARAQEICRSGSFHLIETVAEQLAARLLQEFHVPEVRVKVRKVPVLDPRVDHVTVEIVRRRS